MFAYTTLMAIVALIMGFCVSVYTKKGTDVIYSKLDNVGRITNVILLIIYVCLSPLYLFFGMISTPAYDGILGIVGWVISIVIASASLFCALGLSLSIYFRRRGNSKISFYIQFLGFVGIGLSIVLYIIFAGNIIQYIN